MLRHPTVNIQDPPEMAMHSPSTKLVVFLFLSVLIPLLPAADRGDMVKWPIKSLARMAALAFNDH